MSFYLNIFIGWILAAVPIQRVIVKCKCCKKNDKNKVEPDVYPQPRNTNNTDSEDDSTIEGKGKCKNHFESVDINIPYEESKTNNAGCENIDFNSTLAVLILPKTPTWKAESKEIQYSQEREYNNNDHKVEEAKSNVSMESGEKYSRKDSPRFISKTILENTSQPKISSKTDRNSNTG